MSYSNPIRLIMPLAVLTFCACESVDYTQEAATQLATGKKALTEKNYPAAEQAFQLAVEAAETARPIPKNDLSAAKEGLIDAYIGQKKFDQAETALKARIEKLKKNKDTLADLIIKAYRQRLEITATQNKKDAQIPLLQEMVTSAEGRPIKEADLLRSGRTDLGDAYADAAKYRKALELFVKAERPGRAIVVKTIQAQELASGDQALMADVFFKEVNAEAAQLDRTSPYKGLAMKALAEFQEAQGRKAAAADAYEQAVEVVRASKSVTPATAAAVYTNYAKLLKAQAKRAKRRKRKAMLKKVRKYQKAAKKVSQGEQAEAPENGSAFRKLQYEWGAKEN